jgi:hypothetical protein
MRAEISLEVREPQNHIRWLARAIRHPKLGQGSAVGNKLCRQASAVAKRVQLDDGSIREPTEYGLLNRRFLAGRRRFLAECRRGLWKESGNDYVCKRTELRPNSQRYPLKRK